MIRDRNIPAVVVGGTLNSLGVVRSLSRAAIPTYVIATSRTAPAAWSRYASFVATTSLDGEPLVRSLTALASRLREHAVLILTADESVETVSAQRERIENLYRLSLPAHDVVLTLGDKILFHQFAEREGFTVPRSVALTCPEDLDQLGDLRPPLILKPASKLLVLKGLAERAVRADTLDDARAAASMLLSSAARVLAQEWIDGRDDEIFFTLFSCDRSGQLLALFTGRKLLSFPPAIGSTAVCVAAPEAEEPLSQQTLLFIRRTGYRGLGSLEFKRERATGRFLIVEPTVGRTDWQEEIATLCGVNLPLLTYWSALDGYARNTKISEPSSSARRCVAWRSSAEHRNRLKLTNLHTVDGFFRWSDPLPGIYYYGYRIGLLRLWRRCSRLFLSLRKVQSHCLRNESKDL